MIKKYSYGTPFNTESVVKNIPQQNGEIDFFDVTKTNETMQFAANLAQSDIVYGLGQAVRGINKRGWIYESFCSDDPFHTEDKSSLYGAHNFLIIDGEQKFGVYFDFPGKMTFDIGYTDPDKLTVTPLNANLDVYIITGESCLAIVKEFRELIGKSYIPPMWAFGFQQSRWSYGNADSVRAVADGYQNAGIPLDTIYLDIDYMVDFKDFTIDDDKFPDFESFVAEMKARGIRLIPIIDAGVKIEQGYDVYEEGVANNYFCKDKDGNDFAAAVWPGLTHFPDFLNPDARKWFGAKYKKLTDMGIEGFWNDMNEPAIFYSAEGFDKAFKSVKNHSGKLTNSPWDFFELKDTFARLANSGDDYRSFYHNTGTQKVCHYDVHNLFGFNMTRSAAEGLQEAVPDKRTLLFSRASYIGMHRYAGIWTGDNHSWWGHILNQLKVMPSLNMCGFLYSGADLGGFNANCTEDLLLRWLALGVFTPLLRNHSAIGTRDQEFYRFKHKDWFANFVKFRYRLLPYLYSEFLNAVENNEMLFRPLAFDYPDDESCKTIEDQLMLGQGLMIAPVYTQNADGRNVYLPEGMTKIRLKADGTITQTDLRCGYHYIKIPLNELVFFVKHGYTVPLTEDAQNTDAMDFDINPETATFLGDGDSCDLLYEEEHPQSAEQSALVKKKRIFR
ncbi:MAG: alpha-glucosidase [Oscillospiraceae bacterium]|nr:alpha-glucosidase [Oscillospiraceae bacterium]